MKREPHLPVQIPQFRQQQPSGLWKQLPSPPEDEVTFSLDPKEHDGLPAFRERSTGNQEPHRSFHSKQSLGVAATFSQGSNGERKHEEPRQDSRNPVARREAQSNHTLIEKGYQVSKDNALAGGMNSMPQAQSRKNPTNGLRKIFRGDQPYQPILPGPLYHIGPVSMQKRSKKTTPPTKSQMAERLEKIRGLMAKENLDFYIVPSEDEHGSVHVAACDKRLQFISGFTGPIGQAIIMKDSAYLFTTAPKNWTQFVQPEKEIDPLKWTIVYCGYPGAPLDWMEWLADHIGGKHVPDDGIGEDPQSRIGVDGSLISYDTIGLFTTKVKPRAPNLSLICLQINLVDMIWPQKPRRSLVLIQVQARGEAEAKYSPRYTAIWKLKRLRDWIRTQLSDISPYKIQVLTTSRNHVATLITSLESISYLLNLRESDIPYKSTFHSYLFVSLDTAVLFVEGEKLDTLTRRYLESIGVQQRSYTAIWTFIRNGEWGEGKILLSPQTPYAITLLLNPSRYTIAASFVEQMRISDGGELEDIAPDGTKLVYPQDDMSFGDFVDWLVAKMADGYSISGYENVAGNPNPQNDGNGKTINVYATKPLNTRPWKKDKSFSSSQLPARSLATELQENSVLKLDKDSVDHAHSQSTVAIRSPPTRSSPVITPALLAMAETPGLPEIPDLSTLHVAKLQDPTQPSGSSDALELASITNYSYASSRTVFTDYGLFYTRGAYSEETILSWTTGLRAQQTENSEIQESGPWQPE